MSDNLFSISPQTPDCLSHAKQLAEKLHLTLNHNGNSTTPFLLVVTPDHLEIQEMNSKTGPIMVDFLSHAQWHRLMTSSKRRDPLIRAIGLNNSSLPYRVIDATAGLGRDAVWLAYAGCDVTLLERSPVIAALLEDGIQRAATSELSDTIARMHLVVTESRDYLEKLQPENYPEVIYLDPMFPERKKSALVKKEMQLFQKLFGEEENPQALLEVALRRALKRVVVKRPSDAPTLSDEKKPTIAICGPTIRFDVYQL